MNVKRTILVRTQEQKDIRNSHSKRILVEANAGAAKTTTAADRIAGLVERGVDARKILALSFTRPGVRAFERAFARIGIPPDVVRQLRVGTVEDFCLARLERLEGSKVRYHDRPEMVRSAVIQAIAEARSRMEEKYPGAFSLHGSGELAVEGLLEDFARIKGSMALQRADESFTTTPQSTADLGFSFTSVAVLRSYERERTGFFDGEGEQAKFRYQGDATYDLAKLLTANEPIFTWDDHPMRLGLQAVILDEMHDCNWAIFTVLRSLLEVNPDCSFLGVGDRDQVIHTQDGADSYFMKEGFDRELGAPQRLPLTLTHRFGEALARPLGQFARKPYSANPSRLSAVEIKVADTVEEVFHVVAEAVTSLRGLSEKSDLQNLAVLLRHPGDAVELEHLLLLKGMPYETVGFKSFLERPEVLFVRMILAAAGDIQGRFSVEPLKAAKRATWQFVGGQLNGEAGVEDTERIVDGSKEENFRSFVLPELLRSTNPNISEGVLEAMLVAGTNEIGDLENAVSVLKVKALARNVFVRRSDMEEVDASIAGLLKISRNYTSIDAFLDALHQFDRVAKARSEMKNRIVLSTIEAAKGLEFDHVIIPDANIGAFDGSDLDEKNLFYVATSRACNLLTITHQREAPSSYLTCFTR